MRGRRAKRQRLHASPRHDLTRRAAGGGALPAGRARRGGEPAGPRARLDAPAPRSPHVRCPALRCIALSRADVACCRGRAHVRTGPYLEIFELLLERGADASILSYEGWEDLRSGRLGMPQSVFDVATDAGLGWKPGRVRRLLRALVDKHAAVPKKRPFRYAFQHVSYVGHHKTMR